MIRELNSIEDTDFLMSVQKITHYGSGVTRLLVRSHSAREHIERLCIARPLVSSSTSAVRDRSSAKNLITKVRPFSTTTMKFTTPSEEPPKHEMAYFPNMTTSLPSESGDFRRVLWTGLYSQLVLMTVPVDGEIGDEVSSVALPLTHARRNHCKFHSPREANSE